MSNYKIKKYSYEQAEKLGVEIKPSTNKNKKIDVFKDGKKVGTAGQIGYSDYATYLETKGKQYADFRRRLYKIRHSNTMNKPNTNSWWASRLLW